jgi:hypothetical protein
MPRTLTARYTGTCRRCDGPITPGDTILFLGKRNTVHENCAERAESGVIEIYFPSTGNRITRNRRGTCEDAPACGCCTF